MTEIKVILDDETINDFSLLSKDERTLFFDNLSKEILSIPKMTFDSFNEMQSETIDKEIRYNKPKLKELLLRKIIELGKNHGSKFNTLVIPMISSVKDLQTRNKIKGGLQVRKNFAQQSDSKMEVHPGTIKIRFDKKTFAAYESGGYYIAPPNEELFVIGIIFNPICEKPKTMGKKGQLNQITDLIVNNVDLKNILINGNYTYKDISGKCSEYFDNPSYSLTRGPDTINQPVKISFFDMDGGNITRLLENIFDYLVKFETYNYSWESAIHIYNQLNLATSLSQNVEPRLWSLMSYINEPPAKIQITGTEKPRPDIINILETLHYGRFSNVYLTALLADVDMRGFSRIYYKAMIKGKDDKSVKEQLDIYEKRKSSIAFYNSLKNKSLIENNKLNAYKIIIGQKLGIIRLAQIEEEITLKPSLTVSAANILNLLKPGERKPVETEYQRKIKYLEAVLNNKCPHVSLYRRYRHSINEEKIKKYFNELKKFFNNHHGRSMISCKNCNFDIMCPHVREYTEMDLAGKSQTEIKSRLTKYIDKSVAKDSYYCKICGEVISSMESFGDIIRDRDINSNMNEELKTFMWSEIVSLIKYLKFDSLVNVSQLVVAIRSACYPYISEIEKQILKSKTNSAEEIKSKKRLFITIYAFAYMINLILSNTKNNVNIAFKNFVQKNSKNVIVDLIKHSLDVIITSKNVIIREIPGMTGDIIKNKLIEAYKSIQSNGAQVMKYAGDTEDIFSTLLLDPVYKYLYIINVIDGLLAGKKAHKSKMDLVDQIDSIMGKTVSEMEKSTNIFENVKIPTFNRVWGIEEFENVKILKHAKTIINEKDVFDNAYKGYIAQSFKVFNEKLRLKLYNEPMYINISADNNDVSFMDVKFREPFEVHQKHCLNLLDKERILLQYKNIKSAKNWTAAPVNMSRRWSNPHVKLGRIYDENGRPHVWNVYIVGDADNNREINTKEIAKNTENGIKFEDKILDKKCSVCGIRWAHINGLDDNKILESLNSLHVINNFFRFYENRCPKGNLHDFGKNTSCVKCKMDVAFIGNSSTKNAISYYQEYKSVYNTEKNEFNAVISIPNLMPRADNAAADYTNEYLNWSFNFNSILDLANKLKINHRLLSALGAVEKQEYNDIQTGAYIPAEAERRNDTRIYVLNTHIKNLITEYNQIKYFHRLNKPSNNLSNIIDNSGINKHKINLLSSKLPDIFNDYHERFKYMKNNKNPRAIVDFCLQNFCEKCLIIYADTEKETEKLRHDFVQYFVNKILRGEELVSKPGHFNWNVLYGERESKTNIYDTNFNEKESPNIDNDDENGEDNFGDTSKPFETDFDMENDGDGDDDDSNQVRVEGFGLD